MKKTLVVLSHKLFHDTPRGPETTGAFTIQMDALAPYFERVILCVPIVDESGFHGIGITAPNVQFHPFEAYQGRLDFLYTAHDIRREMLKALGQADLALAIMPGYAGVLGSILCHRRRLPLFQWVVSHWSQNVIARRQERAFVHRLVAAVAAPFLDKIIICLTRHTLTFYTGRILYNTNQPHHHVRISSSIQASDCCIQVPSSTLKPPVRLLFVGRLSREKGVKYLLEAVAQLREEEQLVEVHLVGTGTLEATLHQEMKALALEELVHFHGFVPHSDRLFQLYRNSDVFILPSLQEQQGKVLLEAMSQGLPIIATNVGGIPTVIQDQENGLLVPPADPQAISQAVQQMIQNAALRERLIKRALDYARYHTVEAETERMMRIVEGHFDLREKQLESTTR